MKQGIKELLASANAEITTITVAEALQHYRDDDVVVVDIRDIRELERDGKIPGSVHAPRGMLEFWVDPESPYHKPVFAEPKRFIFHCAGGLRSALATQTVQRMGLNKVCHIDGGFKAWREAGGPVEMLEPS